MSIKSVTSSKPEKVIGELTQELESLRALNSSLRGYLEHIQGFKQNLAACNDNFLHLAKVNGEWLDCVKTMKSLDKV